MKISKTFFNRWACHLAGVLSFWSLGIFCLLFLLYFRYQEAITRSLSYDEYSHFHFVYLLSRGKIPHKDFFSVYSPVFHLTLYPIFKYFGEKYLVLTLSRVVVFFYFLLCLVFTFGISRFFLSLFSSFMVVLIAAAYPLPIEKALEVRPDNLMVMLCLGGMYFMLRGFLDSSTSQEAIRPPPRCLRCLNFFLAGVLFMLSFLVMTKIIFTIGGFLLSVILFVLLDEKARKKVQEGALLFFAGGFLVLAIFIIALWYLGILTEAIPSIFIYSAKIVSALRFGSELHPLFWFYPNDAIYGTYKGLSWYVSTVFILIALVGVGTSFLKMKRNRFYVRRLLLFFPMIVSFAYLYMVVRPYHQYLLPFLAFVPFFIVFALEDVLGFFWGKIPGVKYLVFFFFMALSILSMQESWQVKKRWYDDKDRKFIQYILTHTKPDDRFWPGSGHIFRLDGYYVYYSTYFEFLPSLKRKLPSLIPMLEERQTKYLWVSTGALLKRTWPFDNMEVDPLVNWIKENFKPSDYPDLWVRKESI